MLTEMWIGGGPHQTIQLRHRTLAAGLADVPDFDTAFATGIDVTCGVADGNSTDHLAVAQRVDLTGVARNTWADQGVRRKGHGLHLTVCTDVKGVGPERKDRHSLVSCITLVFNKCVTVTHLVRHLRFASRNWCEAGWKAWSSHVGVRIKALKNNKMDTFR